MPLDLDALAYESLADRPSKVTLAQLGRPTVPNPAVDEWIDSLPDQLAGKGIRKLRDAVIRARSAGRPVAAAMGGHVIKTGCGPYLVDWIDRGLITSLAMNGSASIHDLELAISGQTSEDVGPRLIAGTFGFARETSELFAEACEIAAASGSGLGAALGDLVLARGGPGVESSVLVAARRRGIPLTIHVAIGTDIVHMWPRLDGAALGRAALDDFRILTEVVADLADGVWMNIGSAVVMPEVFLKAVAIVRNLGRSLDGLTTANLDFQQQYRGLLNVLQRPGAEGIAITGHHEISIPLLHAAVVSKLAHVERSMNQAA
ncbi:MAG: hypothetical protein SFX72_17740 [Isosphaeraceae bacterium]|nr:hypothetical protein [Isosphaeraceae bacterium]